MTTIEAIRELRARAMESQPIFFAFDALPPDKVLRSSVIEVLEEVFVPFSDTQREAAEEWLKKGDVEAARSAILLARVPGADKQLWEAIESWSFATVVRGLDKCILKAKGAA